MSTEAPPPPWFEAPSTLPPLPLAPQSPAEHGPRGSPYRVNFDQTPHAEPFTSEELRKTLIRPLRLLSYVLAEPARLAATSARSRDLRLMLAALLCASITFTLPYGAILDARAPWRLAALFLGSTLICFPSLYVGNSYLGSRMTAYQSLSLALVIPSTASAFLLGFAPILWFLRATDDGASATTQGASTILIIIALAAGVGHCFRCMRLDESLAKSPYGKLLLPWSFLYSYVVYRMGIAIALW